MKRQTRMLLLALVGSVAAVVVLIIGMETVRGGPASTSQGATAVLEGAGAYRQGPERAMVTMVEFSDYQCPACKGVDTTVKRILASNRDRVALVYRNYPLPQHKNAMKAATVVEASGAAGAYWQMHDRLFETKDMWAPMPDPTDYFVTLATGLGIDPQVIRKAIAETAYASRIGADVADGNRVAINSTPTSFVNGRKVTPNRPEDLEGAVARALR